LTHLEFNLRNPSILGMGALTNLAQDHEILLYDARGNGMSDWEVEEISLDAWVRDLEVVVDSAGYDRFALSAGSQAAPVGISYAARHPDRLTHLILYGGYALGWRKRSSAHIEQNEALMGLMRVGWGAESPAYRQLFTSLFMPDASKERWDLFNEAQRISASSEAALRVFEAQGQIDVRNLLPEVRTPTLVMHSRGDLRVPFEYGRQVAAGIPGARFVALPGNNHILQPGEPAAVRYLEEVRLFLGG